VAETSMRPMRSANSLVAVVAVMVSLFFQIFDAQCGEMAEFMRRFRFAYLEGNLAWQENLNSDFLACAASGAR
jgi:hypothetical protein